MNNMPPPDQPWIQAKAVDFFHGSKQILYSIDLDLYGGRHYVVAGPNGAGKSTFLDIVAKLKIPAAGSLRIAGLPAEALDHAALAQLLALAPQEFHGNFAFSVGEVVAMGRKPYLGRWGRMNSEDKRIVAAALADLSLAELAERPITALSGGEKRRAIVVRALVQTTPILLLDEPNAGLDIAQAMAVMALAKRLAEKGALVVTVSHDLNLAAAFSHEMIFLKHGRIAAMGRTAEVFRSEIIADIYETDAKVEYDRFSDAPAVSFRPCRKTDAEKHC